MREKALDLLLVEDNAGDARLLREMFSTEKAGSFELECNGGAAKSCNALLPSTTLQPPAAQSAANWQYIPVTETKMEHCGSFELGRSRLAP